MTRGSIKWGIPFWIQRLLADQEAQKVHMNQETDVEHRSDGWVIIMKCLVACNALMWSVVSVCSVCPQVEILQGQLGESVPWRASAVSDTGTSCGICKWRTKRWAVQPGWSVCSSDTDDSCKPDNGRQWNGFPYIDHALWVKCLHMETVS